MIYLRHFLKILGILDVVDIKRHLLLIWKSQNWIQNVYTSFKLSNFCVYFSLFKLHKNCTENKERMRKSMLKMAAIKI